MKKIALCVAVIILVAALRRSECSANESGTAANNLAVDDENIYEGMDKAYRNGYEPLVSDGKAVIVLPVYEVGEMGVTSIRAVPELGATENTPFVYKNYQKTVQKTLEKINGTEEEKEIFLVQFEFQLQDDRYNGVYPIQILLSYDINGAAVTQTFTTYVQITDGRRSEAETSADPNLEGEAAANSDLAGDSTVAAASEKETTPTSEPKVIVIQSEQTPEKIESGSEFTIKAVLKNTNKKKSIQNITVTVSCEAEGITLLEDSNVFYYESLGVEKTLELPLHFKADEKTQEGKYSVTLAISYDNPDAEPLTSEGKIDFNVYQNIRVNLEAGTIASEINAGDSVSIPIQAVNLGRGNVYNVSCSIEAPGLSASKSLFLGNMEGGTAASGELTVFAGMKNPDAQSEEERYGRTSGKIILTYEDEDGNTYTQELDIVTTIKALSTNHTNQQSQEEEKGIGMQLILGFAAVVLIILAGTAIPLIIRWKRKRLSNAEEGLL